MGIIAKFVDTIAPECSLCSKRLVNNRKKSLLYNFDKHKYSDKKISNAKYICSDCEEKLKRRRCGHCSNSFPMSQKSEHLLKDAEYLPNVAGIYFCKTCLNEFNQKIQTTKQLLDNWVDGTKSEYIRGYDIVKTIDLVKYDGADCEDPNQLEEKLKILTANLGGNGFIKFFWNKEIEKSSKRVLAGYSKNDNPYYKTKYSTQIYFTGSATAVYVEAKRNHNPTSTDINEETYKYVIECSQTLEKYIENNLNGKGKGLHEKITSIEGELSEKDMKSFRFIATARNNIIHEGKIVGDAEKFKSVCEQLKSKYNLK